MAEGYEPNPNPSVTSDLNVEITNYTSYQNQYTCPEDGYIFVYITGHSGNVEISMLPNGHAGKRVFASQTDTVLDSTFVRRGTTVRVYTNTANGTVYFRGIKYVY